LSAKKLLVLAPQPFFQERGTPIAVKILLETLSKITFPEDKCTNQVTQPLFETITLLTYHEGSEVNIPGVTHKRTINLPFTKNIRPGLSIKKIILDSVFFLEVLKLLVTNRKKQFDVIHAVEESVFIAFILKFFFKVPYVYDMDSGLAEQVCERWKFLKYSFKFFSKLEDLVCSQSLGVLAVCSALVEKAKKAKAPHIQLLPDIALLDANTKPSFSLREEFNIKPEDKIVLYVGNLEDYQGVELLINAFLCNSATRKDTYLIILGGTDEQVLKIKEKLPQLTQNSRIIFGLHRSFAYLSSYLAEATILASPRLCGSNTPMKLYNYLASAKPIIATNIVSHTQVLTSHEALLVEPLVDSFAEGIEKLLNDVSLQQKLASSARKLSEEQYTYEIFTQRLKNFYLQILTV
jgi:glycosyltransferase involved in cell wall biosynthesis